MGVSKMRKIKRMGLFSVLCAVMIIIAACGNNATQPSTDKNTGNETKNNETTNNAKENGGDTELPTIKVGMVCGGMTPLLAQIGINDGSFKEAGVNAEEVCFSSGSDAIAALVGGSIDVNLGSYEHVLKMTKNNLGIKAYGSIYNGVGYSLVVKKDSPYENLADMKGETLAVTKPGSLSDSGLRKGLEKEGLDPTKDVKIIGSGSGSTMLASIESGKVAGGMVSEPTVSQMISSGDYRVLYDPDFDYAGIVIMSDSKWVDKNKETMQTFLKELTAIYERAQEDPKHVVETMQGQFENVPTDVLETAITNQINKVPAGLKLTETAAEAVNQTAIQLEIISEPIPFEDAVDLSLLQ
jgi:NitT/TauT family transport system substrate-binding protein